MSIVRLACAAGCAIAAAWSMVAAVFLAPPGVVTWVLLAGITLAAISGTLYALVMRTVLRGFQECQRQATEAFAQPVVLRSTTRSDGRLGVTADRPIIVARQAPSGPQVVADPSQR